MKLLQPSRMCAPQTDPLSESDETSKGDEPAPAAKKTRNRQNFSWRQVSVLEQVFETDPLPWPALRMELAQRLGITPRCVQVWFQNRRQKWKAAHQAKGERISLPRKHSNQLAGPAAHVDLDYILNSKHELIEGVPTAIATPLSTPVSMASNPQLGDLSLRTQIPQLIAPVASRPTSHAAAGVNVLEELQAQMLAQQAQLQVMHQLHAQELEVRLQSLMQQLHQQQPNVQQAGIPQASLQQPSPQSTIQQPPMATAFPAQPYRGILRPIPSGGEIPLPKPMPSHATVGINHNCSSGAFHTPTANGSVQTLAVPLAKGQLSHNVNHCGPSISSIAAAVPAFSNFSPQQRAMFPSQMVQSMLADESLSSQPHSLAASAQASAARACAYASSQPPKRSSAVVPAVRVQANQNADRVTHDDDDAAVALAGLPTAKTSVTTSDASEHANLPGEVATTITFPVAESAPAMSTCTRGVKRGLVETACA